MQEHFPRTLSITGLHCFGCALCCGLKLRSSPECSFKSVMAQLCVMHFGVRTHVHAHTHTDEHMHWWMSFMNNAKPGDWYDGM